MARGPEWTLIAWMTDFGEPCQIKKKKKKKVPQTLIRGWISKVYDKKRQAILTMLTLSFLEMYRQKWPGKIT